MKHLFIVNPVAGGSDKTEFVAAKAAGAFPDGGDAYEIYVTKGPMDACRKIQVASACGEDLRIYACGGDGTLNECVCGAAGRPNVAVTHFPCGTGNDFIKTFGEEKERFFDLSELINGEVRPLDIIDCNGRYSANICSVGLDARIGADVHKYSRIPVFGGAGGYVISTAVHLCRGIHSPFRVKCADSVFDGELTLMCACNGRYYGGGFNPVPDARPDDGVLDFLIVRGVSLFTAARVIGKYAKGEYDKLPEYITHLRGISMEIESDKEVVVNIDGEVIRAKNIYFRAIPGGVNFILPANMAFFKNERMILAENQSKKAI